LTPEQMEAITDQSCVKLVDRFNQRDGGLRILYDIRACKEVNK
jgi:hypothetical protein